VRHQGKFTGEWVVVEARLADVLQRETTLEASRVMEKELGEQQVPTFTTASQNVAMAVVRLNVQPTTPANDGGKVCR
jgi:hypothetical protein